MTQNPSKKLTRVRVRMYRPGLGDSFLLTFTNGDEKEHHMMIDLGVLQGTKGGADRMRAITEDILTTTGNHLHTVVATHEHWDHISGFQYARKLLGLDPDVQPDPKVTVDQVWLPWTEDLNDDQVKRIIKKKEALSMAITASIIGMDETYYRPIGEILRFGGEYVDPGAMMASSGRRAGEGGSQLRKIMDGLRGWGETKFLEPNDVLELPEFGVKIYVLGPSREMSQLGGSGTPAHGSDQGLPLNQTTAFLAAVATHNNLDMTAFSEGELSTVDVNDLYKQSLPFDPSRGVSLIELKEVAQGEANQEDELVQFFREHYGASEQESNSPGWRRIDREWMRFAEALALQQVSTVNNTSLVLAIELVDTRQVLLFSGDAEEESWETWTNEHIKLDDLFQRTVLYKVGHHGSINATWVEGGLEKMGNPELVAMIPVDKDRASENNWNFPAPSLYEALKKKTNGRIIINCEQDCPNCDPTYSTELFNSQKVAIEQDQANKKLWVDYILTP